MAKRTIPDDLMNPVPHTAPGKSVIDKVLGGVLTAGNGVVTLLAGLLAGVLVLYSGYVVYDSFDTQYKAYESAWDLLKYKPEYITDENAPLGASELEKINEDYRAWLTIYDTSIDYPVVQGPDNVYYANYDIYRNRSQTGAIYLAPDNSADFSDSYNLVYGHHMQNGAMFGRLDSFKDTSYLLDHKYGIVVSKSGAYDLELFAVITTDAYESRIYSVGNRADDVRAFLEESRANGQEPVPAEGDGTQDNTTVNNTKVLFYDETAAASADRIFAMSTCARAATSGRLVVLGKMTKRNLVTLTLDGYNGVYDGKAHGPNKVEASVEGTTISYSEDDGKTWTSDAPTITDAGTKTILVHASHPANGEVTAELTLTVNPRPVTVTVNNKTVAADQTNIHYTATVENTVGDDTIEYTIECTADTSVVGDHPGALVASGPETQGNGNYTVSFVAGDLKVVTAGTLVLDTTADSGVYNGKPHGVTATPNVEEGTTVTYSTDGGETWSEEAPSFTDVGTYPVIVRAENPKYDSAEETVTVSITPAQMSLTVDGANATYDGKPHHVTGVPGVTEGTTVQYSEDGGKTWTTDAPEHTEKGDYPVRVRATNPNYDTVEVDATLHIGPAQFKLDVTPQDGEYDGKPHTVTATPSVTDGTTVQYSTDGGKTWTDEAPAYTDAGDYPVQVKASNPNYEDVIEDVTLHITPATLTLTVTDPQPTYDGEPHSVTSSVTGINGTPLEDAKVEYSTDGGQTWSETAPSYTDAGTHDVMVRASDPNYKTAEVPGTLTINPADMTLTVTPDDSVYDGKPHGVDTSVTGINDTPLDGAKVEYSTDGGETWTTEAPTFTDAGDHEVQVRAEKPNGNYNDTDVQTVTVSIKPADMTLTVTPDDSVYDGQPHGVTTSVTGVDGKPVEGATVEYSTDGGEHWTTTPPTFTDAGDHEVQVRAKSPNENYNDTPVQTVTVSIKPATGLTVEADDIETTYDGQPHTVTGTPSVTDGTTVEYSVDGGEWTTTPPTFTDAGDHTVTIRATNPNYETAEDTVTVSIEPADMKLTVTPDNSVYDGEEHGVTTSVTGVDGKPVEGATVEYSTDGGQTWTTDAPTFTEIGEHEVQVRAKSPNENYNDTPVETVKVVITEPGTRPLTIKKVWQNDTAANRPATLNMVLTADGIEPIIVTLSATNNWQGTATVPETVKDYTWQETQLNNYNQEPIVTEGDVTTITNRRRDNGGGGSTVYVPTGPTGTTERTLTIRYRYGDGSQAADTYTTTLASGEAFDVASPTIEGYTASLPRVTGTMGSRNLEYTVTYLPDEVTIEDYGTPLGLGGVYVLSGSDCIE